MQVADIKVEKMRIDLKKFKVNHQVIGLPLCYFLEGIDLGRFTGNI
jgi:hypothetical protein